jgi:hypothetical protein
MAAPGQVALSPDGQRLAAWGGGGVQVWETSPVPPEHWYRRELARGVYTLFDELLLKDEVAAALRKRASLSEADREFALRLTHSLCESDRMLNWRAWEVVKLREGSKEACTLALHQAEAGVRLAPKLTHILTTLGVAQYRTGRYADALATLTKSAKVNATKQGPNPIDLAFLAMAEHQLGKKEEAQVTLGQLREVMKRGGTAEAQGFLREAEETLKQKPASANPGQTRKKL